MLISIIAAKPQGVNTSHAKPADELALKLVTSAVGQDRPAHKVRTASSLGQIVAHLEKLRPGPNDHVQLIGHGTPGRLALGYFWTHDYSSDTDTYALDCDLSRHGVLDELVDPAASVAIIGCAVGEDRVGMVQGDGPTLIFDLARLWSCRVSASVGAVGVKDFDKHGQFLDVSPETGALRVVTAFDRSVSRVSPQPPPSGPIKKLPKMTSIRGMKILGPHETPERRDKTARELMAMGEIAVREIPYRSLLGLPEIVATLEDGTVATFLSNSSIIRVAASGTAHGYVDYAPETVPDLQKAVRHAIHSAF